ncbi:hypothetical protein JXA47_04635 [Candidatus Sumerlaeota bacterium]|nr:hypothetical protein [Candidatus Sumerlaeota bacterium]
MRHRVRSGFTRKIFHFAIFMGAAIAHIIGEVPTVNAYAVGVVTVILIGVWRGAGDPVFEGMARERDASHRAFYVVVPLLTTIAGGIVSNLLAGEFALVGYLVTGCGDAVGEPIGVWLGRHEYHVPTLRKVPCTRSLEGSAAVALVSSLGAALALVVLTDLPALTIGLHALLIAALSTVLEAFSPHGSDNFTTMVGASVLAMWLAG